MNEDIFAGQWKQMRGTLRSWWGKLTDDDLENIGGQKDKLIGAVQEKYGYSRDQAESEVAQRFENYHDAGEWPAAGRVGDLKSQAYELGERAANKTRGAVDKAGSYLQENRLGTMASDLGGLMRKYPTQAILAGVGLVYLLFRKK